METRTINIQGMSCGHCVARVNKTLAAVPGISVEDVQVGSARITFDPARTPLASIGAALADAGYPMEQDGGR